MEMIQIMDDDTQYDSIIEGMAMEVKIKREEGRVKKEGEKDIKRETEDKDRQIGR